MPGSRRSPRPPGQQPDGGVDERRGERLPVARASWPFAAACSAIPRPAISASDSSSGWRSPRAPNAVDRRRADREQHARDARQRDRAPARRAEPGGVDRQAAARRPAHERDGEQRHADLRRPTAATSTAPRPPGRRGTTTAAAGPARAAARRRAERAGREHDGSRRDQRHHVVDRRGDVRRADVPAEPAVEVGLHRDPRAREHHQRDGARRRGEQGGGAPWARCDGRHGGASACRAGRRRRPGERERAEAPLHGRGERRREPGEPRARPHPERGDVDLGAVALDRADDAGRDLARASSCRRRAAASRRSRRTCRRRG